MPTKMKVFAGPPGTGKTYAAAREAVRVFRPDLTEAQLHDPAVFAPIHTELVEQRRIFWVTFHPSYAYEDFVEGFRPVEGDVNGVSYAVVKGPFSLACERAGTAVTADRFHVGQRIGPGGRYEITYVEAGGVVLRSEPERDDAVTDTAESYVDFWTLRRFEQAGLGADAFRIPGKENGRKQAAARAAGVPSAFFANSSRHAAVYDVLMNGAPPAANTDVVLVIDEMNRADLSRVMGELMTLLERDKRAGAAEERSIMLPYSRRRLTVPPTLSVIGTMNTADKSIGALDIALRRRFEFVLVPPDPSLVPASFGGLLLRRLFEDLNLRLALLSGRDNLLGHADFMHGKLVEVAAREGYGDSPEGQLKAVAHVLRTKTVPLLLDLFRADWARVRAAVGHDLFGRPAIPEGLFREDWAADLEDVTLLRMERFWDPDGEGWDPAAMRAALASYAVPPDPGAAAAG